MVSSVVAGGGPVVLHGVDVVVGASTLALYVPDFPTVVVGVSAPYTPYALEPTVDIL